MIVGIVPVLEIPVSSLNVAVNKILLIALLDPLHLLSETPEEPLGEHLIVHEVVSALRQCPRAPRALDQGSQVLFHFIWYVVHGIYYT
jgi:hypothetical protein